MARLTIDTGTAGNTATGDSIRSAFTKVNANFTEIYNELGSSGILSDLNFSGNTISTDGTNQNLILDPNGTGKVIVEGTIELGGLSFDSQTITGLTTNSNIKLAPAGTGSIDVDTSRIINVTDPTSAQDAATKNYVDTQLSSSSHNITFVGDDSTGTAVTQGETFKIAGTQNITTAVSGDTLTITGPDLTNYLNSTQISVSGNKISSTESNADIELDPAGTGDIVVNSGDVLPATDNTQYLGSASKRWHTLYVGPGSININGVSISESSGTIQIPGGTTGTQGLGALLLADPTQVPYSDVDNQGAAFTFDANTVFYDTETKEAIATKVSSDLDWAGWTIGDAFPNSLGLTPATFTHTHSAGSLTGLKLASGGSGMTAVATDNILAFRVGDPITTFIVTPYSGLLGTVNTQSSTQSDLTATNSLSVGGLATVYGESIFYDNLDVKGNKITNLGTPTAGGDAATKSYVDTQLSSSSHNITFVGDDSTGTAVTQGETFKFAGATGITTAVSGDTLTITGTAQDFAFGSLTGTPTTLSGYGITDGLTSTLASALDVNSKDLRNVDNIISPSGVVTNFSYKNGGTETNHFTITSTGTDFPSGTTVDFTGATITGTSFLTNSTVTLVGDDSTGTTINSGETFKIAGGTNITTAVSGDTLTITGPDLSSYVTASSSTTFTNKTLDATTIIGTLAGNDTSDNTAPTSYTIRAGNNTSGDLFNSAAGGSLTIQGGSSLQAIGGAVTINGGSGGVGGTINIGTSNTAVVNVGTEMKFGDWDGVSNKDSALFGAGSDLRIYHDGTDSRITDNNGSGNLKISTSQLDILGGADGAETMATFVDNGAVTLYYDNGAKLATTATGVSVTGNITASNTNITLVGDDSTGTTIDLGETFKIAGATGITTAVSGDTLTVTGPDLSNYLQNTGTQTIDNLSFNDNIISTSSNADLNLNPGGTGQVVANSALKINKGYIEAINSLTSSSTITVDFAEASVHTVTLAENTQFVVTNLPTGGTGTIIITQDGGGTNTASFGTDGSTAVKFAGGTPTLSTAGGAIDVVTIFNDGTNYLGNIAKAYA